jgi:hypothetical protein
MYDDTLAAPSKDDSKTGGASAYRDEQMHVHIKYEGAFLEALQKMVKAQERRVSDLKAARKQPFDESLCKHAAVKHGATCPNCYTHRECYCRICENY